MSARFGRHLPRTCGLEFVPLKLNRVPAKAGTQSVGPRNWTPAFAGEQNGSTRQGQYLLLPGQSGRPARRACPPDTPFIPHGPATPPDGWVVAVPLGGPVPRTRPSSLAGQPLLQPFDRIVAALEFRVLDQGLVERNRRLDAVDDEFLERPAQPPHRAF